jgi:hypothetical protein
MAPTGRPPTGAPAAPPTPAALDLSASIWRHALELRAPRLPADIFTAVALIDSNGQPWLVQRGDRQDPSCLPSCDGKLELRIELDRLTPGPFQVAVVASPKPIGWAELEAWLPHASERPPAWGGVRAYAVAKVTR